MPRFFKQQNQHQNHRTKNQQGSTIVELLIATLVVGSVITGIAVALTYNIHQNAEVRYREAAANMNQQVLEVFRRERERNSWDDFYTRLIDGTTYCVNSPGSSLEELINSPSDCTDTYAFAKTTFKREAIITKPDASADQSIIQLTITTYWHANTIDETSVTTSHTMRRRSN